MAMLSPLLSSRYCKTRITFTGGAPALCPYFLMILMMQHATGVQHETKKGNVGYTGTIRAVAGPESLHNFAPNRRWQNSHHRRLDRSQSGGRRAPKESRSGEARAGPEGGARSRSRGRPEWRPIGVGAR